jgi:hypothetical protein
MDKEAIKSKGIKHGEKVELAFTFMNQKSFTRGFFEWIGDTFVSIKDINNIITRYDFNDIVSINKE